MSVSRKLMPGLVALVGMVSASPALAGITFEQKVTSTGAGRGLEMRISGWAEEGKAKIVYEDSNNPVMDEGSYLLTTDGGETVYLVDPKEKTYSRFDMAQVMSTLASLEESSGGMVQLDFTDPVSEELGTGPGEPVLGYRTTRHEWRSGYTMKMKVAFVKKEHRVETVTDALVTDEVYDPGLHAWLRAVPATTGDPELDQVLTGDMERVDGLVLRMEQRTTTTNAKGRQRTTTTHYEVTRLETGDVDDSIFEMPAGYEERPLIPETAGQGGEGEQEEKGRGNPLKSIFG